MPKTRRAWVMLVSGALLLGCGEVEESEEVSGAITNHDFAGTAGRLNVRIKACNPTLPAQGNQTTCPVDSDYVLVGGGAEVLGLGSPGALLTASEPSSDRRAWRAASKDHSFAYPHQLRAYSIGLRVQRVSRTRLQTYIRYLEKTSLTASHPSLAVYARPGYQIIGGGVRTEYGSAGQLLVQSRWGSDVSGDFWYAESKDHRVADPGRVVVTAIEATTGVVLDDYGVSLGHFRPSSWCDTLTGKTCLGGYCSNTISPSPGVLLTSIGAKATYNSGGRMLTQLVPFFDYPASFTRLGTSVVNKDHGVFDSGTLCPERITLQLF